MYTVTVSVNTKTKGCLAVLQTSKYHNNYTVHVVHVSKLVIAMIGPTPYWTNVILNYIITLIKSTTGI